MKKSCMVIVLLTLMLSVIACGDKKKEDIDLNTAVQDEIEASYLSDEMVIDETMGYAGLENELYSTVIAQESEFYTIISNNPIDRDFVWDGEVGSDIRIRKAVEYRDLWNLEIDYTLAVLKDYLTDEDYKALEQAHESWMQYIDKSMTVEQNIFYPGMFYGMGSNDTYPLVMEAVAERTKRYAIELMALEYAFTGTVEFSEG